MSTSAISTILTQNPFEAARAKLIERLSLLVVPKPIRIFPGPSDFQNARDLLRETAEIFDDYVHAIGSEVENNSPYPIDLRSFDAVASCAISDAAYECDAIAEKLQDEREAA